MALDANSSQRPAVGGPRHGDGDGGRFPVASSLALAPDALDVVRNDVEIEVPRHLAVAPIRPDLDRRRGVRTKRVIDVVVASLALVVLAPVIAVAAAAIKLETRGPALFRQQRTGRGGRSFTMYKLRSMVTRNDDSAHRRYVASLMKGEGQRHGGIFKLTNDPRLTRVGRFLRRTSIDEVPQLVNVVRGDMSLVGPRPPLPSEVAMYDERDWGRLAHRPGLTGLWQVSGRCELTYREMIELDLHYVDNWNLWLDLRILMRTPRAILSQRGAA